MPERHPEAETTGGTMVPIRRGRGRWHSPKRVAMTSTFFVLGRAPGSTAPRTGSASASSAGARDMGKKRKQGGVLKSVRQSRLLLRPAHGRFLEIPANSRLAAR